MESVGLSRRRRAICRQRPASTGEGAGPEAEAARGGREAGSSIVHATQHGFCQGKEQQQQQQQQQQ